MSLCRRSGFLVSSTFVVYFAHGCVSAAVAGDVSSNDPLQRDANTLEVQVRYNRVMAQLNSENSECDNWRFPAREQGGNVIDLSASPDTSKNDCKVFGGQIAVLRNKKRLLLVSETHVIGNWLALATGMCLITLSRCKTP